MDETGFRDFLKKDGRSLSVVKRCIRYVRDFEEYLRKYGSSRGLEEVNSKDLESYVECVEREPKASAKTHLWALRYYFEYVSNEEMRKLTGVLRGQRIKRKPFVLKEFRGVNLEYVDKLVSVGVKNVGQMLKAGMTRISRQSLSKKSGVPAEAVLEFVKLSDLARIPGVKGIRARLYYDAGVDTVEKLAESDPKELREMLVEFVERSMFDGIAPLPKEAEFTVETAKKLPKIVEW
jgi:hypothetical protein